MLITILAVPQSRAAYVPMDPNYPDDRIKYILSDTNTTLVLTNNSYTKRIKKLQKVNVIPVDDNTFLKELNNFPSTNTRVKELISSNLAYVIYTSGTTGNPKGVLQLHCNVRRLFTATDHCLSLIMKMFSHYFIRISLMLAYGKFGEH